MVRRRNTENQWTARYERRVLTFLNGEGVGKSVHLSKIYAAVFRILRDEKMLEEGEDLEYRVRWVLSNMQKRELVKNTKSSEGEWAITEHGSLPLCEVLEDL